jgi:hypothetical protein
MNGLDVFLKTSFFPELFLAVGTFLRYNRAVQSEVTRVALLLQRQPANRAAGHLGRDAEVAEHVAHQCLVVFEIFITVGAHLE